MAPEQWPRVCEDFSLRHRGWLAATRVFAEISRDTAVLTDDQLVRCTARDLRFTGLSLAGDHRDVIMHCGNGRLSVSDPVHGVTRICVL